MNRCIYKSLFLFLFFVFYLSLLIDAEETAKSDLYYEIGKTGIHIPLDSIVLIREDNKIGGFKFVYYEDKKAEYEWYYPIKGNETRINKGKGTVEDKFWTLLGRLSFQSGEIDIILGPLKAEWTTNNVICFFYEDKDGNNKYIELAPTNKTRIEDIDLGDPKIKWYKYDENRKSVTIPLSDL